MIETKLYKRRFAVLIVFSAIRLDSEMIWITFSPVTSVIQTIFNVSASSVNLLSSVFFFTYLAFALPASWGLERFGLRGALSLSGALLTLGCWIRFFGSLSSNLFWLLFIGQAISSLSQLFTLQSASAVSGRWFGEKERTAATSVGYVVGIIGNLLAFLLCPVLVKDLQSLKYLLLTQALFATLVFISASIFVRDSPPTQPSIAAEKIHSSNNMQNSSPSQEEQQSQQAQTHHSFKHVLKTLLDALKALFTNLGYIWTLVSTSCVTAVFWAFQTVAEQVLIPDGFTTSQAGIVCAIMVAVGCLGTFILGLFSLLKYQSE